MNSNCGWHEQTWPGGLGGIWSSAVLPMMGGGTLIWHRYPVFPTLCSHHLLWSLLCLQFPQVPTGVRWHLGEGRCGGVLALPRKWLHIQIQGMWAFPSCLHCNLLRLATISRLTISDQPMNPVPGDPQCPMEISSPDSQHMLRIVPAAYSPLQASRPESSPVTPTLQNLISLKGSPVGNLAKN